MELQQELQRSLSDLDLKKEAPEQLLLKNQK